MQQIENVKNHRAHLISLSYKNNTNSIDRVTYITLCGRYFDTGVGDAQHGASVEEIQLPWNGPHRCERCLKALEEGSLSVPSGESILKAPTVLERKAG